MSKTGADAVSDFTYLPDLRQIAQALANLRIQCLQGEWFDEHSCVYSPEEKFNRGIVTMTGKEDEPLCCNRSDPGDCPVKHLTAQSGHHHIAEDDVEDILRHLLQAFHAAWHRGHLKTTGDEVIAKNFPIIIAIFQEQNLTRGFDRVVRQSLALGSDNLCRSRKTSCGLMTQNHTMV